MAPPDLASATGVPAGYGRSCVNCSRAKCRCILRPKGDNCERCHRLGKECQQMVTARKRTAKRAASSRTAQLEEKLDDLVSMLRATQNPNQQLGQDLPAYSPSPSLPSRLDSLATAATTTPSRPVCGGIFNSGMTPQSRCPDTIPHDGSIDRQVDGEPTPAEAEVYLAKFKGWLKNFPFIHIPAEVTAETLQQEKPFLWLCIMNITSMSHTQQQIMRERVRQEAAQKIVIDHERTMDILLGLVAYLGWASMNTGSGTRPFLITYTQLAAMIVYSLGLTKDPNEERHSASGLKVWGVRPPMPIKERTMEERRVVLALWFSSAVCAAFLGNMESFCWTSHMEDCLEVLQLARETPLDAVLVALVKVQLIGEEAQKMLMRDMLGSSDQTPAYIFKKNMLLRLEDIRREFPEALSSNYVLQAHMTSTEAQVHAIGLFGERRIPEMPRIDGMYSCLRVIKTWYDRFFALQLTEIPGLSFGVYVGMSQMQALLYRLTTSQDSAWDRDIIRSTADLFELLDKTIERFTEVAVVYPVRCGDGDFTMFDKGAKTLRTIRNNWESILSSHHLGGLPTPSSQIINSAAADSNMVADNAVMTEMPVAEFNDLAWMTDVFGLY